LCLIGAIDDATGELLPGAHFVDQECTVGYLRVLREIVKHKGVPLTAYMDRHGALRRNDQHWSVEEQLAGRREPTQVKRALDELGIQVLYALSPQAKGRVQRLWGTLQDRLVSELRLVQAATIEQANAVLLRYRKDHNARFAIPPEDANAAWRACPPGVTADDACALHYFRTVLNNNTVRIGRRIIDIPKRPSRRSTYAKASVVVRHWLTGRYRVYYEGELIAQATGQLPQERVQGARTVLGRVKRQRQQKDWLLKTRGVTESLTS